jgi:hypothetical protein
MTKSRTALKVFTLSLLCACLLAPACGGANAPERTTATPVTETPGTAPVIGPVDPETLAASVTDTWTKAMKALVNLLEKEPEPSAVVTLVQDLKETTIQSLVALGRQRETLSATDRARVDSLEWSAFESLLDETWYTSYNAISSHYAGVDLEFASLVASFNTITQYSDFALLGQQLPEEATRLGIH